MEFGCTCHDSSIDTQTKNMSSLDYTWVWSMIGLIGIVIELGFLVWVGYSLKIHSNELNM